MEMKKIFLKYGGTINWIIASIVLLIFCLYYFVVLYTRVATDIQAHIMVSYNFVNANGPLTPNFLYFILVAALAGFSKYKSLYYASSILLLAFALSLKYMANVFYVSKIDAEKIIAKNKIILLSVALLFIFCLPGIDLFKNDNYYLGQSAPNVWHNSTVIFLSPFAIMLFFETYSLLTGFTRKKWITVALLIIVNALIKPSFLFTIIPLMAIWAFFSGKTRFDKVKLSVYFLCAIGFAVISAEYFLIYIINKPSSGSNHSQNSSVSIEPFAVWKYYSSSILISVITSFLFPVLFFILTKGDILKDKLVKFSTLNCLAGLLIFVLLIEGGAGKYDGNFGWQMIIGNYLLFFILSIKFLLLSATGKITTVKVKILGTALLLHIGCGVVYFFKIVIFKSYF
jgi:hypothetical protein